MAKKKACKYQFKAEHKGSVIHLKGFKAPITEATLTDEIAEMLLQKPAYQEIIEPTAESK